MCTCPVNFLLCKTKFRITLIYGICPKGKGIYVKKYLQVVSEFMEPSQELMIADKEIKEKYKLRKKNITDFLGCNKSTTSRFINHLIKVRA